MTQVNPSDVGIRPATASDEPFLKRVHDSARHWEFQSLRTDGANDVFHSVLDQQFKNQQNAYFAAYEEAQYSIITWMNKDVGRLYADYQESEVRILDIAVLAEYRDHGIGSVLTKGICIEAGMRGATVRLSVHYLNRAKRLYSRIGFRQIGEYGPMQLLEWYHPDPEAMMRGHLNPQKLPQANSDRNV